MSGWVALDLETTGPAPDFDRIVQIGLCRDDDVKKSRLVNPGVPIPPEATAVHKITDEMVADAPAFAAIAASLHAAIEGRTVITYNGTRFDVPVLQRHFSECGIKWAPVGHIDVMQLVHHYHEKSLEAMAKLYLGEEGDLHEAGRDAYLTAALLQAMCDRHGIDREKVLEHAAFAEDDRYVPGTDRKLVWRFGEPTFAFGPQMGRSLRECADSSSRRGILSWLENKGFPERVKELARMALAGDPLPRKDGNSGQ